MTEAKRTKRDYTLALKLQVIVEVEKGDFTYKEAQRRYGIEGRGRALIYLRKHGRSNWSSYNTMSKNDPLNKKIGELETPDEVHLQKPQLPKQLGLN